MQKKSIFQSKTFWVNLVSGLVIIFGQDTLVSLGATPAVQGAVVTVLNVALRFLTEKPVSVTGE